jgi:hypothetical protein
VEIQKIQEMNREGAEGKKGIEYGFFPCFFLPSSTFSTLRLNILFPLWFLYPLLQS